MLFNVSPSTTTHFNIVKSVGHAVWVIMANGGGDVGTVLVCTLTPERARLVKQQMPSVKSHPVHPSPSLFRQKGDREGQTDSRPL